MSAADFVFGVAVTFVIASNIYFAPRIRGGGVAMQWGLDGKPTWYAPKWLALWGMVAFMLVVRLLIWLAVIYTPQLVHGVDLGIAGFSMIAAGAHLFTLKMAAKQS
jgi:hypothetical protein